MTSLADNWRVCRLIRREGWCVRRPEATTAGRTSSTCRWGARRWPTSIGQVHPARPCPGTQCTSWPWGSWCPGWRWWCTTRRWSSSLRPSPQICCPGRKQGIVSVGERGSGVVQGDAEGQRQKRKPKDPGFDSPLRQNSRLNLGSTIQLSPMKSRVRILFRLKVSKQFKAYCTN